MAIAIVGMAGRFPGADDLGTFWNNLRTGVESVRRLDAQELRAAGASTAEIDDPRYVKATASLPGIDRFDAEFFGYSPRQAQITDPQHRVFTECVWEAIEDACHAPDRLQGKVGLYAGSGLNTYLLHNLLPQAESLVDAMGMLPLIIANKPDYMVAQIAHHLNLTGPVMSVGTACSTSLVAVHMGCQSLLNHEADMVLAGGVSIQVPQERGYAHEPGGVFSPDGHCRPFDSDAQGTFPGNGAGVVVLKRLQDALDDGDRIRAVIRSSAINNDGGRKVGFSAPSVDGQREVIATALALAGLQADQIGYVEAHGTATTLGDPLELKALAEAYGASERAGTRWWIGSVKSNIGHLDAAAGVAGLIKATLCLEHRRLVPTLHYRAPNPAFERSAAAFEVNTSDREWARRQPHEPLRAAVSAFGIGGTNAHVVLEEAPVAAAAGAARDWQVLPLSADRAESLQAAADRLGAHLAQADAPALADVAGTLQVGRAALRHRCAFVCADRDAAVRALGEGVRERGIAGVAAPEIAFLFPGMGEQYPGMAWALYQGEPVFREVLDECAAALRASGIDLIAALYPRGAQSRVRPQGGGIDLRALLGRGEAEPDADQARMREAEFAHPALFAVEYALARLWMSWGIRPHAMLGHSLGEYVAACVAGVMPLADAIGLVSRRAALIDAMPEGAMLGVALPADLLRPLLPDAVSIAAVNAQALSVASGPVDAIERLRADLDRLGHASRRVNSSRAFHSAMLEPMREALATQLAAIDLRPPSIPYLSNLSGDWITDAQATDPQYWAAHTCAPVRFCDGVERLHEAGVTAFVELGPGQSLSGFVLQHTPAEARSALVVVPSLPGAQAPEADGQVLATALAALWCAGADVDWAAYQAPYPWHRVSLPTYAFSRQRYWVEAPTARVAASAVAWSEAAPGLQDESPAVPAPLDSTDAASWQAPEGEVEALMAELWSDILGVPQVGREDHFFRLGGSSLLAVRLLARLRERLDVVLPIRALFERPTLRGISALLEDVLLMEVESASDAEVRRQIDVGPGDGGGAALTPVEPTMLELPNRMQVMQFNRVETDHFYHDIFETRVYARNGIDIPDDAVVLDIGANIGLFSLFVCEQASNARIYAFEPAPPVFGALSANLAAQGDRVTLFNAGVSSQSGVQRLTFYPYSTGMSSFHADVAQEREVLRAIMDNQLSSGQAGMREVMQSVDEILDLRFQEQPFDCPMRTVSEVVREHGLDRVDLMKIDVQKAERDVLDGIDAQHWPLIRQLVVEVHDLEGRVAEVRLLLENHGYEVTVEQDDLYESSNIFNLYAIRR